jgi:3-oxoacyl-[acyl-carrier protein] reductase
MARAAIITGASRGIGAAVAERLAKDGFSVVVNYAGGEAEAAALVNKITSAGGHAITAKADVSKAEEVSRMFEVAEKEFGGVDVLVNNAGIMLLSSVATSVVGLKLETYGVYAATKAAVETLTAILSKELRGRSITVNAIAPGPTATDLFLHGKSQELIDRMAKMNPLERLGTPQDIAAAVSFLAGPDGGWINGQALRANGGMI